MDCNLPDSSVHGDFPGKNTGVGCHALIQGICLAQGSNPGLAHCRWILYHLSHQGMQKGNSIHVLRVGTCLTLGDKLSVLTKREIVLGKGCLGREQEDQGSQENCSALWPTVSGFRVMGFVSGLSWPVILTQGPSWWHKHCSAKMDASDKDSGRW